MRRVASLVGHALETHPFALAGFVRLCMLAYGAIRTALTPVEWRMLLCAGLSCTAGVACTLGPFSGHDLRAADRVAFVVTESARARSDDAGNKAVTTQSKQVL